MDKRWSGRLQPPGVLTEGGSSGGGSLSRKDDECPCVPRCCCSSKRGIGTLVPFRLVLLSVNNGGHEFSASRVATSDGYMNAELCLN
ncbi:hypothetical protein PC116_g18523 [Phytophthora cactorum]|uniref:Uncharacterized protein n=1 Tax=Phytophthora cactorum TaxID=29920 RepID=A0A8T1KDM4_9STRA|nr:hypothetical protein PC114_g16188 [Phytophthora cactorum]KAG2925672.1 hypothetical protein PC117_g15148 [Phytophthora cactorum]KAG3005136.1 hypothetical protein PC119_g15385 [Phytophthora cactorum]KAG3024117.1 hypothetical protein PC120_g7214 [Phytophthora cactorum]KAG3151060.1 hypothetical protein C6341_g16701 [Phytophthora cactorum]